MKVLLGCEMTGAVRREFRKRGHDAWSCDILPADDGSPYHLQCDVLDVLDDGWDLGIFFPPCTHLASSGAKWFAEKRADGRQQAAIEFFLALAQAPISHIAIENPVGVMSTAWRKPDQIINPWQFGHMEQKQTCLWLKNLPALVPTDVVYDEMKKLPRNLRERLHYLPPSADRWKLRSTTYPGIARAMAEQWGSL